MTSDKTELKKCCIECGFPIDMKRDIVILDNNVLSILSHMENTCETCGHQISGWSIMSVKRHWMKIVSNVRKNTEQKARQAEREKIFGRACKFRTLSPFLEWLNRDVMQGKKPKTKKEMKKK